MPRPADGEQAQRPLAPADLLREGPLRRLGRELLVLVEVDSTNALLRRRAGELPDGTIATAEQQTAGRGRQGRKWQAPRGSSILLSVLLHEPADSPAISGATMLASLAACEAVAACTDCTPAVRWPNDIVIGKKKLGGVLVETAPLTCAPPTAAPLTAPVTAPVVDPHPPREGPGGGLQSLQNDPHPALPLKGGGLWRAVIVGIGLNCLQHRGHFPPELADAATSLELESAQPVDRAALAGTLVAGLDAHLVACGRDRAAWEQLAAQWKAHCADFGTHVTLQHDNQTFEGTVLDIDANGDLIVQLADGGRRQFPAATTTRLWRP